MSKTFHGKSDFVVFLTKSKCQKSVEADFFAISEPFSLVSFIFSKGIQGEKLYVLHLA